MRDLRPAFGRREALKLLHQQFRDPIHDLAPLEGGQVARTFAFHTGGDPYVLQVNRTLGANVEKEAFLSRLLAGTGIPIPEMVTHGRVGDLHFGITRRATGTPLSDMGRAAVEALAPALMDVLEAIRRVDTSATRGFATAGNDGNGLFPSWTSWLTSVREEEPEWDFYGRWHHMFETTFLEREVFDAAFAAMARLLPLVPERRNLVHGNVSLSNILAHDGAITAVLDWQEAGYGDFACDVAQLDFWDPGQGWAALAQERAADAGDDVTGWNGRIACYQIRVALDAMRFFAKRDDEGAYRWVRSRVRHRIADPGRDATLPT